jgi:hypothetical protein
LSQVLRPPGIAIQPQIAANKTANSITIRATMAFVQIFEKIIQQNDKPRAEIVVDVEIMEVNRQRVKQYGLNLSEYALGGIFSPEVSPSSVTTPSTSTTTTGGVTNPITQQPTTTTTTSAGKSTAPSQVQSPPPFNLNTITRGITTADFYLAVPTAIVKFLESDINTKLVAKPQLRGAEGTKLTFKVGDQIPVISTSYLPIAGGGAGTNPLSSYNYKDVGVTVEITPRVTLEGEILLDVNIINNSRGSDVNIGGVNIPSFGNREVNTRLRLRDGESNLLAGLLREDERKSLTGFPGAIHVPVLQQLFSQNDEAITQTDVIMLLTPHVVRGPEITEADLRPIFIGSQQNLALGGSRRYAPAPAYDQRSALPRIGRRPARNDLGPPGARRRFRDVWYALRPCDASAGAVRRAATGGDACAADAAVGRASRASAGGSRDTSGRRRTECRRTTDDVSGLWRRAGDRLAAARRTPRGAGPVQHSDLRHRRAAAVDRDVDAHVRQSLSARPHSAGGQLLAIGQCERHVLATGQRQPRRHHDLSRRRRDWCVGNRPAGGDLFRPSRPAPRR